MGVTNLWQILSPVRTHCPLSTLRGQTLAVDLSIWVVEGQGVKQMQGVVLKPHLRNLFFRISHLLHLGVNLVFVIEGEAPELKWEAMMKRQQLRYQNTRGGKQNCRSRGGKQSGRRNFNSCLRECCELLDLLGVPYVQSQGEAEAMCAALNAAGLVNACLTNDGDAFLYGARTVYRNFTMGSKDPHVECYSMDEIEEQLSLDREKLVAMALLLGCDYLPKGVPGVGMDRAVKLMRTYHGIDVIERFKKWKQMEGSECLNQVEVVVRQKSLSVHDFPQSKVISEFMDVKEKCPRKISRWRRPKLKEMQDFALRKLEWPEDYTEEKILPLLTLWDMTDIQRGNNHGLHLMPYRIVKKRVKQGVECYEILWNKEKVPLKTKEYPASIEEDNLEHNEADMYYTTVEEQGLFTSCFPDIVRQFEETLAEKKSKSKGKKTKTKSVTEERDAGIKTKTRESPIEVVDLTAGLNDLDLNDNSKGSNDLEFQHTEKHETPSSKVRVTSTGSSSQQSSSRIEKLDLMNPEVLTSESHTLKVKNRLEETVFAGYQDDINDSDILLSVLDTVGACKIDKEDDLDLEEIPSIPGEGDGSTIDNGMDNISSGSEEEEYVPLSQRIKLTLTSSSGAESISSGQQPTRLVSQDEERSVVHVCKIDERKSESELYSKKGAEGVKTKMKKNGSKRGKTKNRRATRKDSDLDYESEKENLVRNDYSNGKTGKMNVTEEEVSTKIKDMSIKFLEEGSLMAKCAERKVTQEFYSPSLCVQSPSAQILSPHACVDPNGGNALAGRMNFTSVSTPIIGELSKKDGDDYDNLKSYPPKFELIISSPLERDFIESPNGTASDDYRTNHVLPNHHNEQINASQYKDAINRCSKGEGVEQHLSPITPFSIARNQSFHAQPSLRRFALRNNCSMNSTAASFALEYGNFNISSSLIQNFSQHSLILSLMAEDNPVYGSPFVPSEVSFAAEESPLYGSPFVPSEHSVNLDLSDGSSPLLNKILLQKSSPFKTESTSMSSIGDKGQLTVSVNLVDSPKFESNEVRGLSFYAGSVSKKPDKYVSCPGDLTEVVKDLSFTETQESSERKETYGMLSKSTNSLNESNEGESERVLDLQKQFPRSTDNQLKHESACKKQHYGSVIGGNVDQSELGNDKKGTNLNFRQPMTIVTDSLPAQEESPVALLDRLRARMSQGSKSVLLNDFIQHRKVSVKPIVKHQTSF